MLQITQFHLDQQFSKCMQKMKEGQSKEQRFRFDFVLLNSEWEDQFHSKVLITVTEEQIKSDVCRCKFYVFS